ncbi:unnamed protein product [Closterium sp. NIES-65]|nr:unnamed protein product [Closterium sp. NIES-65]
MSRASFSPTHRHSPSGDPCSLLAPCSPLSPSLLPPTRQRNRFKVLLTLLPALSADFLCVQEMDEYEAVYRQPMAAAGWESVYVKRPGKKRDGSGIFYRSSRFRLLRWQPINFNDLVPPDHPDQPNQPAQADTPSPDSSEETRDLSASHVSEATEKPSADVKLAQAHYLLQQVAQFRSSIVPSAHSHTSASVTSAAGSTPVTIICGDFNSLPGDPLQIPLRLELQFMVPARARHGACQTCYHHIRMQSSYSHFLCPILPLKIESVPMAMLCALLSLSSLCAPCVSHIHPSPLLLPSAARPAHGMGPAGVVSASNHAVSSPVSVLTVCSLHSPHPPPALHTPQLLEQRTSWGQQVSSVPTTTLTFESTQKSAAHVIRPAGVIESTQKSAAHVIRPAGVIGAYHYADCSPDFVPRSPLTFSPFSFPDHPPPALQLLEQRTSWGQQVSSVLLAMLCVHCILIEGLSSPLFRLPHSPHHPPPALQLLEQRTLWAVRAAHVVGSAGVIGASNHALLEQRTSWGQQVSSVLLAMLAAAVLASLSVLPTASPVYDFVWTRVMPMAVALVLLETDVTSAFTQSGPGLLAFLLGAAGTIAGTLVGFSLAGPSLGVEGWKVAACFCATYIGGSVNYAATAKALGMDITAGAAAASTGASLLTAGMAVDNLLVAAYFSALGMDITAGAAAASTGASLLTAGMAVDNLLMAAYFSVLAALPDSWPKPWGGERWGGVKIGGNSDESEKRLDTGLSAPLLHSSPSPSSPSPSASSSSSSSLHTPAPLPSPSPPSSSSSHLTHSPPPAPSVESLTLSIAAAASACALADKIAVHLPPVMASAQLALAALLASLLSTVAARLTGRGEKRKEGEEGEEGGSLFTGAETLGNSLMLVFFANIGASASVSEAMSAGGGLLAFVATVLMLMVASNANVGGPATAAAMASARNWPQLVRPAVLLGTFGYTIGTAIAFLLGINVLQPMAAAAFAKVL